MPNEIPAVDELTLELPTAPSTERLDLFDQEADDFIYILEGLPDAINTAITQFNLSIVAINAMGEFIATSKTEIEALTASCISAADAAFLTANAAPYVVDTVYAKNQSVIADDGYTYRAKDTTQGEEPSITPSKWKNLSAVQLEQLLDVPFPSAGKFLQRKSDNSGYIWADAYSNPLLQINNDLQKVYTDVGSFHDVIENLTNGDMIAYKSAFRDWFKIAGNTGFIDELQDQNIFNNIMNSQNTLAFLCSFDEGYDWIFSKISNLAYQVNIVAMITAGRLDSIKTISEISILDDIDNTAYISKAEEVSLHKVYAYISKVSALNDTNTTTIYAKIITDTQNISTPEVAVTANAVFQTTSYTPEQYGGILGDSKVSMYSKSDDAVGNANAKVEVVSFSRPTPIILESAAGGISETINIAVDLSKPYTDDYSFFSIMENGLYPDMIAYKNAFKDWWIESGNVSYVDINVDVNVYQNIVGGTVAFNVLATFQQGAIWLESMLNNATLFSKIITILETLPLSVNNEYTGGGTWESTTYQAFDIAIDIGGYGYINYVKVSNEHSSYTGYCYLEITDMNDNVYTTPVYSKFGMVIQEHFFDESTTPIPVCAIKTAKIYIKTNLANAVTGGIAYATIAQGDLGSSSLTPWGTSTESTCAVGDWACIVKEDLSKPLSDTSSFSYKINNSLTGSEIDYVAAYRTLLTDATFISGLVISGNAVSNILATPALCLEALSPSKGSPLLVDYFGANYGARASDFTAFIANAITLGYISSGDLISYSAVVPANSSAVIYAETIVNIGTNHRFGFLYETVTTRYQTHGASLTRAGIKKNGSKAAEIEYIDATATYNYTIQDSPVIFFTDVNTDIYAEADANYYCYITAKFYEIV